MIKCGIVTHGTPSSNVYLKFMMQLSMLTHHQHIKKVKAELSRTRKLGHPSLEGDNDKREVKLESIKWYHMIWLL